MLIVGLGNPGSQYEKNRHNVGFLVLDELASTFKIQLTSKYKGEFGSKEVEGHEVMLFKPFTYMNLCGPAVSAITRFYKIPLDEVVVIHDELDLPLGKVRVKKGGGSGGHNGLRSIDAHVGSEYYRIRVGIGHPGHRDLVTSYVLGNFINEERSILATVINALCKESRALLDGNLDKFQSAVAQTIINANK